MEAVKVLSERNKTVYKDLKCWGPKMRIMVYYALQTCHDEESLPAEFTQMNLQALYKNKGSRKDLNNYWFLHLRSTLAKLFEYIMMMKVKDTMYHSFPEVFSNPECLQGLVTAKDLNLDTATTIFTFITSNQGCLAITEEGRR